MIGNDVYTRLELLEREQMRQMTAALSRTAAGPLPAFAFDNFGADATGTTDSTDALQNTFDAAIASNIGARVGGRRGTYKVSDTIELTSVMGLDVDFAGITLTWAGADDRPMFKLADCRQCTLRRLRVNGDSSFPLQNVVQLLNDGSLSAVTPQNNRLEQCWFNGVASYIYTPIVIGGTGASDANNDFNIIRNCHITNYRDYGVEITHSQSYNNRIENTIIYGGTRGVFASAGYFNWVGGFCGLNTGADFYISGASANLPITIQQMTSEGSARFLECLSTAGPEIAVEHCRIAGNGLHADGEIVKTVQARHIVIRHNVWNNANSSGVPMRFRWQPDITLARHPGSVFVFEYNTIYDPNAAPANPFPSRPPTVNRHNKFQNESTFAAVAMPVYSNTFTNADTTPSVILGGTFKASNAGATTITAFDDGYEGQEITVIFTNGNTTISTAGTIKLAGAVNFTGTANDVLRLRHDGTNWLEISRSVN